MKFDFDGEMKQILTPQIKQIAGRAGRFGVTGMSSDPSVPREIGGIVTSMNKSDMDVIREALATPNPPIERAYLWPPWRIFEKFAHQFPEGTPLATLISRFVDVSVTTRNYQSAECETAMKLAHAIEHLPNIDLESRYNIIFAPVQTSREEQVEAFIRFAEVLSSTNPVTIESTKLQMPLHLLETKIADVTFVKLQRLEFCHKIITLYCWLS